MTLTLDNLTSEEIRIVQEAERRGIRFEALVKGLIAGLRETAAPEHAPVPGVISAPNTAAVPPAEFSARLRSIPRSAAPWPTVSVEDTSREAIYADHD
jgi:hypothetical protein